MKSSLLIILISLACCWNNIAQDSLSDDLQKLYDKSGLPGFAVSIINEDGVLYQKGFGYENLETKKEFTTKTVMPIASVSKTFAGIALMKVVKDKLIDLETPINEILPFEVFNPRFPDIPITIRQLASHTSSIDDYDTELNNFVLKEENNLKKGKLPRSARKAIKAWSKNHKKDLSEILFQFLNKEGKFYKKRHFLKSAPGEKYKYSNVGTSLLGLIIEIQTGVPFDQYVQENIINEINLAHTSWLRNLHEQDILSKIYFENLVRVPLYESQLYPAGGLYSSCEDLSIYIQEMIKGYEGKSEILSKEMFRTMMTPKLELSQSPPTKGRNYGFFWELDGNKIGHNGGNYGVVLLVDFDKETKIGRIFMTNVSSYQSSKLIPQMVEIWKLLESESLKINQ